MITKKVLSDKYVGQLYEIFESKNWNVQEAGRHSVFDRFCERLSELENDMQRDLVIDLTKDFLWVKLSMYEQYLLKAFYKLFQDKSWNPKEGKNICICPMLPEKDFGKVKSSTFMLYLCQSILLRTYTEFQDEQIRICETPEVLKEKKYRDNMDSSILSDDFIGSGETALECLTYLDFLKQEEKKLYVLALVAQKQGIENIRKEGISVFVNVVREKGITDKFDKEEAQQKLDEMEKISKLLQVSKKMLLGYLESESLVAMNKTPNNTFPVYWHEGKGHSHAPFPRKENVKVIRMEKEKNEGTN